MGTIKFAIGLDDQLEFENSNQRAPCEEAMQVPATSQSWRSTGRLVHRVEYSIGIISLP